MSAKCPSGNISGVAAKLFAYRKRQTGGIEHAAHAHKTVGRQTGLLESQVGHNVKRVGNTNIDSVRRSSHCLLDNRRHDAGVNTKQVFTGHARFASDAGGDYHDVGIGGCRIVVSARYLNGELFHRTHVHHIKRLALRKTLCHVHQNDVGEILGSDDVRSGCANIACTYDSDLAHYSS